MRYAHIYEQVYCRPWLILPSTHAVLRRVLADHLTGRHRADSLFDDMVVPRPAYRLDQSTGIARISVQGIIGKGLSKMEKSCGMTSTEDIHAELDQAQADGARGIFLQINSPGGTVTGLPELASRIRSLDVPTRAYTDDMAASAAYWLAAAAGDIVASPSAEVGSVGVYIPWIDQSAAWDAQGLRAAPIVNTGGDLKATGFGPTLTDAQRAHLQESVDETFDDFRSFITADRAIPTEAMRGQTLSTRRAMEARMIDYIGSEAEAFADFASALTA